VTWALRRSALHPLGHSAGARGYAPRAAATTSTPSAPAGHVPPLLDALATRWREVLGTNRKPRTAKPRTRHHAGR